MLALSHIFIIAPFQNCFSMFINASLSAWLFVFAIILCDIEYKTLWEIQIFLNFFSCLLQQKFFLPERRLWYVMKKNKKSREFLQFLFDIILLSKKILILSKKIWHCQRNLYIAIRFLFFTREFIHLIQRYHDKTWWTTKKIDRIF